MEYLKKHWKKIIGMIAVVAILVFAYWYGGKTPDSKGFSVGSNVQLPNTSNDQLEEQYTSEEDLQGAVEIVQQENTDSSEEVAADNKTSEDVIQTGGASDVEDNSQNSSNSDNGNSNKSEDGNESGNKSGSDDTSDKKTGSTSNDKSESSSGNTQTGNKNEPATQVPTSEPEVYTCTISIYCDTVLNNMDLLDPAKTSIIPSNGCILSAKTVEFTPGESVFDVLQRVARQYGIPLEYSYTAIYGSSYIEGINNLYEFDCGEASGWIYLVNGYYPGYGSSQHVLNDKDVIKWVYTCNLGADVGNPY